MSIKESNLTTINASDLDTTDYVRVLDSSTSRKITVDDLITVIENNAELLSTSGGTLTGDLTIYHNDTPSLTIQATGTSTATLSLIASAANVATIELGDINDADIGQIEYDNSTNTLTITTNATTALTIDSSQNVTIAGDLAISGGNITSAVTFDSTVSISDLTDNRVVIAGTSGLLEDDANLTFDGTTFEVGTAFDVTASNGNISTTGTLNVDGASTLGDITIDATSTLDMGANKLTNLADPTLAQDAVTKYFLENQFYEQGTWTPVLSDGTFTATATVEGYYERVGDLITYRGNINVSSLGSMVGTVRVTGLPYNAIVSTANVGNFSVDDADNLNITAIESVCGVVISGSNYAQLQLWDATAGTTDLLSTELTATSVISFSGSYRAV
jgi:hypothetical protein